MYGTHYNLSIQVCDGCHPFLFRVRYPCELVENGTFHQLICLSVCLSPNYPPSILLSYINLFSLLYFSITRKSYIVSIYYDHILNTLRWEEDSARAYTSQHGSKSFNKHCLRELFFHSHILKYQNFVIWATWLHNIPLNFNILSILKKLIFYT